nr:unnamed protein product [Callosobruchus chinensis]
MAKRTREEIAIASFSENLVRQTNEETKPIRAESSDISGLLNSSLISTEAAQCISSELKTLEQESYEPFTDIVIAYLEAANDDNILPNKSTRPRTIPRNNERSVDSANSKEDKQRRKKKPEKTLWFREQNKKMRMEGKPYVGFGKDETGKLCQNEEREARMLETSALIARPISALVKRVEIIRPRVESSRKGNTYKYFLKIGNNKNQVCKMFLNTLGINEWTCNTCVEHEVGNICDITYKTHIELEDRARKEKEQVECQGKKCITFSMDVQAVKLCPLNNASKFYYKARLKVHNFAIYDLQSRQCPNY